MSVLEPVKEVQNEEDFEDKSMNKVEERTDQQQQGNRPIQKVYGVVKWFNVNRGFGFITRKDLKQDVFVHRSGIRKPNRNHEVPSLADDEVVEFFVVAGDKGAEAKEVTGPNGRTVKGSHFAERRGYYDYGYNYGDYYEQPYRRYDRNYYYDNYDPRYPFDHYNANDVHFHHGARTGRAADNSRNSGLAKTSTRNKGLNDSYYASYDYHHGYSDYHGHKQGASNTKSGSGGSGHSYVRQRQNSTGNADDLSHQRNAGYMNNYGRYNYREQQPWDHGLYGSRSAPQYYGRRYGYDDGYYYQQQNRRGGHHNSKGGGSAGRLQGGASDHKSIETKGDTDGASEEHEQQQHQQHKSKKSSGKRRPKSKSEPSKAADAGEAAGSDKEGENLAATDNESENKKSERKDHKKQHRRNSYGGKAKRSHSSEDAQKASKKSDDLQPPSSASETCLNKDSGTTDSVQSSNDVTDMLSKKDCVDAGDAVEIVEDKVEVVNLSDSADPDSNVVVVEYTPQSPKKEVFITGEFCNWKNQVPLMKSESGEKFVGRFKMPVGKQHIKFVVDGKWVTSNHLPIVKNTDGYDNNVVEVPKE